MRNKATLQQKSIKAESCLPEKPGPPKKITLREIRKQKVPTLSGNMSEFTPADEVAAIKPPEVLMGFLERMPIPKPEKEKILSMLSDAFN